MRFRFYLHTHTPLTALGQCDKTEVKNEVLNEAWCGNKRKTTKSNGNCVMLLLGFVKYGSLLFCFCFVFLCFLAGTNFVFESPPPVRQWRCGQVVWQGRLVITHHPAPFKWHAGDVLLPDCSQLYARVSSLLSSECLALALFLVTCLFVPTCLAVPSFVFFLPACHGLVDFFVLGLYCVLRLWFSFVFIYTLVLVFSVVGNNLFC